MSDTDILNMSTATTAAEKASEVRQMAQRAKDERAARMFPSVEKDGLLSKSERVLGDQGDPRFQDPSAYRVASDTTKMALKMYPSLATDEHYDAKIEGKNDDGSDRVLIRSRRDVQ